MFYYAYTRNINLSTIKVNYFSFYNEIENIFLEIFI